MCHPFHKKMGPTCAMSLFLIDDLIDLTVEEGEMGRKTTFKGAKWAILTF